jgi:aspartyl aminopeptidase
MISATHTDSPMLKIKKEHLLDGADGTVRLSTEPYGGMIYSTWLDRPLSVAGRVVICRDGCFETKSVMLDRDLLVIPNVAIHFNRTVNSGYAYNPATDLVPLFAGGKDVTLLDLIAAELGCLASEIVGTDLFVYNRTAGTVFGAEDEFFASPRIDNLMCTWGCLDGLINSVGAKDTVKVFFAADNEETGSATKQGAGSVFLSDVVDLICESFGTDRRSMLASSMMVSADNAHAKHPNHPELSDAKNAPAMNGGVVIKINAAQKYTTDGLSGAIFEEICRAAGVPVQYFHNRSDMAGGSTLGSISNTNVPLLSVDIGMAQLAMHSAYETAGCRDVEYLSEAMRAFYASDLRAVGDGRVFVNKKEK